MDQLRQKRNCVIPIMLLRRFLALCQPNLNLLFNLLVTLIGIISFTQGMGIMAKAGVVQDMVSITQIIQVILASKRGLQAHIGIPPEIRWLDKQEDILRQFLHRKR